MKYLLPLMVVLTLVIGSVANIYINSDDWYGSLIKSSLNPPSFIFGIVWPILYALMAIIAYKLAHKIAPIFIMQLLLNAAWSWIFFYFHAPLIALLDIVLLIYLNLRILIIIKSESRTLYFLYLPYIIWLLFAAFLNASIVFLN
ncbi:MAG: tryptophan-rich sensory protein [SAR86 cluster bacterium]|jgi:tryptophan-rich sensory protein|nr:tryptophan-rich sensory protein [SAR86 cluster bacterium]